MSFGVGFTPPLLYIKNPYASRRLDQFLLWLEYFERFIWLLTWHSHPEILKLLWC
jgi:hypothetical protein